jgi:tetratricopeptide (TPR) repeat protein
MFRARPEDDPAKRAFSVLGKPTENYTKELNRAIAAFDFSLELNPDDAESYMMRGLAYRRSGDVEHAVGDFSHALELNPDNAAAYFNRARVYGELGQYQRSIEAYSEAIRLDPYNGVSYAGRASAYTLLANDEAARQDIERVLELRPGLYSSVLEERIEELRKQRLQ